LTVAVAVALVVAVGLAVPKINLNVQSLGSGNCSFSKFLDYANVTIGWNITPVFGGVYVYTLKNITLSFSNNVTQVAELYVKMVVYGLNTNSGRYEYDNFTYAAYNISIRAGVPYVINNTNTSYSYYVAAILPKPKIVEFKVVVLRNDSSCVASAFNGISMNLEDVEVGSSSYAPLQPGEVNITVLERSGTALPYYVVNFSLPGNWTGLYPVLMLSNGTRIRYWYSYVPSDRRTWFWAMLNLSANENLTLRLYYGNASLYNPSYVNLSTFWMYSTSPITITPGKNITLPYFSLLVSALAVYGYSGYSVIMFANLSNGSAGGYGPYYLAYNYTLVWSLRGSIYYLLGYGILPSVSGLQEIDVVYERRGTLSGFYFSNYTVMPMGQWGLYQVTVGFNDDIMLYSNGVLISNESLSWVGPSLSPFIIGQDTGGNSTYRWIGVVPYKSPPPLVIVHGIKTSDYSFTVYFLP